MPGSAYVFMIPGFLGFIDLGRFEYFRGVCERLGAAQRAWGSSPTFVRVEIHPSASLRERATQLAQAMHDHAGQDERPIHLVAHSTGGLDARLMLTPGASLPLSFDLERLLVRVRSLVTIATPHHGTPLASFFDGLLGQRIMRLGSTGAAHALRASQIPIGLAERLVGLLSRVASRSAASKSDQTALASGPLDQLDALPQDERGPLQRLLERMAEDQALVPQLAPEGLELFNTSTNDRPGVRYGCVVARAPRPGIRSVIRAGVRPAAQTSSALYSALHQIAARTPEVRAKCFDRTAWQQIAAAYGDPVEWVDSDGVVPTLSQVWGQVVHAASADHLDVVGHFADDVRPAEHHDVFVSGASFGRAEFDAVWRDVAGFLAQAEAPAATPFGQLSLPQGSPSASASVSPSSSGSRSSSLSPSVSSPPAAVVAPVAVGPGAVAPPGRPPGRPPDRAVATATAAAAVTAPAIVAQKSRQIGRTVVIRLVGSTLAFFAYEAWRGAVGSLVLAHWLGFVVCAMVVWFVLARIQREP
ncbi:MAG: triacylglycerol lipase [Myxococcota bacterium]